MVWFIIAIVLFAIAVVAILVAIFSDAKGPAAIVAGLAIIIGGVLMFIATFWSNGVGEAKVMVNSVDRQVVGVIDAPGSGFKPAWVDFVEFDLFSQEITYAGGEGSTASYNAGNVNGKEVTVSVGGVGGGSTRANIDINVVYSLDSTNIKEIYTEYRSQERFTQMVVEKTIRSTITTVPSGYTAANFRGADKPKAAQEILEKSNAQLGRYGVEVSFVNIQDPRYPEAVEASLTAIEEANQAAQKAEADQRTAVAVAEKLRIEAEGQAAANAILNASLTPAVLEMERLAALKYVSKNGDLIIDGGSGGLLINRNGAVSGAQ